MIMRRRQSSYPHFICLLREAAKMPFHESHLARSGFGKPKAAKLDSHADAVVREIGARRGLGGRRQSRRLSYPGGFAV